MKEGREQGKRNEGRNEKEIGKKRKKDETEGGKERKRKGTGKREKSF